MFLRRRKFILEQTSRYSDALGMPNFWVKQYYLNFNHRTKVMEMIYEYSRHYNDDNNYIFYIAKLDGFDEKVKNSKTLTKNEFEDMIKTTPPRHIISYTKYQWKSWEILNFSTFPFYYLGAFNVTLKNRSSGIPELPQGFKTEIEFYNRTSYSNLYIHVKGLPMSLKYR